MRGDFRKFHLMCSVNIRAPAKGPFVNSVDLGDGPGVDFGVHSRSEKVNTEAEQRTLSASFGCVTAPHFHMGPFWLV